MDPMGNHDTMSIFSFDSSHPKVDPPSEFATGSDIDIGGLSTCQLTAVPSSSTLPNPPPSPGAESSSASSSSSHIAFHGHMSLQVPPQYAGRIRTGYASFRNRSRPTLFGEEVWDLSMHSHIKVVVGYRGWEGWRNRWMCNIQTDGPIRWAKLPQSMPDANRLFPFV
jgi:NADH dehydrogenase [ubiquinone] 1 alpha subcomplex assembly factor 1